MRTLNLGILAHVDAGKTSLTERLLYAAGVIGAVGRVDDGDTQTDTLALERRASGQKLGAIGFCFGGGMVWLLLASGEPRLAAAAPFYGPLPDGADFSGSTAAVLGIYAEQDARVNASREAATAALEAAGLTHEIVTYPGANHAFFNDTGPRYDEAAATQAYAKVLDWFGQHLG